jgi:hypothetical protein
MNSIAMSSICFGCILSGTALGFYFGRNLPKHHLDNDSKDTIKMAWGTVATMAALVLSLLLASAKSSFDTVSSENTQAATKIILLDRVLARYGPETKAVRNDLRNDVAAGIQKMWSTTNSAIPASAVLEGGSGMEQVQADLSQLTPLSDSQRVLLSQAQQLCGDLLQARWLVVEQSRTGLPNVLFVILVFWLAMLFVGLGLFAPRNKTVLIVLFICNLSFSTAIFLINEMSHPVDGMMKISSAPMLKALEHLSQP